MSLPIVNKQQPQLDQDLVDCCDDPAAEQEEWQSGHTVHQGHGRLERRERWASPQMHACCETAGAGAAQVVRLRRHVTAGEGAPEETVYGLTTLPRKQANASRLLALPQAHWRMENRLHYRRDVTLGEDACQVRMSGAPQALAALNSGVLALMDWLQVSNVASQMRHLGAHPGEALQFLYGKLLR